MKRSIVAIAALALSLSACSSSSMKATLSTAKVSAAPTDSSESSATTKPAATSQVPVPVDSPSESSSGPLHLSMGEAVDLSFNDITNGPVKGTVAVVKAQSVKPGQYDSSAKNGRYLAVQVSMTSKSGKFDINPFDFALTDDDGTQYDQAFMMSDNLPSLNSRTLNSGQKASGWMVFDAPKTTVNFAYRGSGFNTEDQAIWRVK